MNWMIVGASAKGLSHANLDLPCQDSFGLKDLGNGWGIAVVSDGAGSAQFAHLGSAFLVKETILLFSQAIEKNHWQKNNQLPTIETWSNTAQTYFKILRKSLEKYATSEKIKIKDLSATLILLIYSPIGLLTAHIGDGRAAFLGKNANWKALIKPWKGEYANETVFVSSDIWNENQISTYLKCDVLDEEPLAFALLTDGLERHSFVCNVWNEDLQKFYDPNLPFDNFFNPLVENLVKMHKYGASKDEIQAKWIKFITEGTEKLKSETDDKTMILAVCIE